MATKSTKSKETRTRYRAAHRPAKKRVTSHINLRWAEIERAPQPLVLERNGEPFAVVLRYTDYQQLREATKQRERETTWERLVADPTFRLPPLPIRFDHVEPAIGEGIDASKLLIEDRR